MGLFNLVLQGSTDAADEMRSSNRALPLN